MHVLGQCSTACTLSQWPTAECCQQKPHLPPGSLVALSPVYSCHPCPCFLIQLLHTLQLHVTFKVSTPE